MRSGGGIWGMGVRGMEREGKNHTWIPPSCRQMYYQYIKRVDKWAKGWPCLQAAACWDGGSASP